MKGLIVLVVLVVILAGFLLSAVTNASASGTDTGIPDNDNIRSIGEPDDSDSASATITITMYAVAEELSPNEYSD